MTGRISLLRTLLEEGIHAAAEFNLDRLDDLVGQQEALLRGLPRPRPEELAEADRRELLELRRWSGLYSRVLLGTSRTVAAMNAARQISLSKEAN